MTLLTDQENVDYIYLKENVECNQVSTGVSVPVGIGGLLNDVECLNTEASDRYSESLASIKSGPSPSCMTSNL
jgi:hypothetical protein